MDESKTNPEMDALKDQAEQVGKELKELASRIGAVTKKTLAEVSETVATASKTTMEQTAEMADKARTRASAASVEAERFIKDKPAVAVGIAAVAGVVAGAFLRRR